MEYLRADTAAIRNIREKGEVCLRKAEAGKENLAEILRELNGAWSGDAAGAFVFSVSEELKKLDTVLSAMAGVLEYQQTAAEEYERCEAQIEETILALS
ncbi:MAG: hypothetical protein IIY55_10185 [Blautia sp.]|nr:hypothetical protein [Blautia sp.]